MSVGLVKDMQPQIRQGLPGEFHRGPRVYAIAFDMDIEQLRTNYGDPYNGTGAEVPCYQMHDRSRDHDGPVMGRLVGSMCCCLESTAKSAGTAD